MIAKFEGELGIALFHSMLSILCHRFDGLKLYNETTFDNKTSHYSKRTSSCALGRNY